MSNYSIVYEDEDILVVDKPAGMLVIPSPKGEANTLTDLLNRYLDARGVQVNPVRNTNAASLPRKISNGANAYPCHRLDRETSGLIVYAKGKSAQRLMMEEFKRRAVNKSYIAFAHGRINKRFGIIDAPIERKRSLTKYRVLEQRSDFCIVEVKPVTGRTNQIRIHFKFIGHPLVGDRKFAFARDYSLKFRRAALHSCGIKFNHPVMRETLEFTLPLPDDMKKFLAVNSK
ncbi:MAG: RluA family pseudouridine synthase [Candidatus Omnitrophota bacterium]